MQDDQDRGATPPRRRKRIEFDTVTVLLAAALAAIVFAAAAYGIIVTSRPSALPSLTAGSNVPRATMPPVEPAEPATTGTNTPAKSR